MKNRISNIVEIQVGYQSRKGICDKVDGSHSIIQGRDFDNQRRLKVAGLTRFSPEGAITKYEVRCGDVLFLAKGQQNFSFYLDVELPSTIVSNSFYILRTRLSSIHPKFLSWWLNQNPAQETIKFNQSGSSLPFLSISALSRLEIPVPSIETQMKICELEDLRKKESNLLDLFLQKKSALIDALCLKAIIE